MKEFIRALFFSGVIYDEKKFKAKLNKFIPFRNYCERETKTDFFAAFFTGDTLVISIRGTDGTSLKKWFAAWFRNFRISINHIGCHRGFYDSAQSIFNFISVRYQDDLQRGCPIEIHGHSAGASVAVILGWMLSRIYHSTCLCYGLGAPPSGNSMWANNFFEQEHEKHLLGFHRLVNPRDIVTTAFRDQENEEHRGVDVGLQTTLPPDSFFQKLFKKVSGVIEHSPREYADGLILMAKNQKEKKLLRWIRKQLVN